MRNLFCKIYRHEVDNTGWNHNHHTFWYCFSSSTHESSTIFFQSMTSAINLFTIQSIKNMSQFYCDAQLFTPSGLDFSLRTLDLRTQKRQRLQTKKHISRRYLNGSDKKYTVFAPIHILPKSTQAGHQERKLTMRERASGCAKTTVWPSVWKIHFALAVCEMMSVVQRAITVY